MYFTLYIYNMFNWIANLVKTRQRTGNRQAGSLWNRLGWASLEEGCMGNIVAAQSAMHRKPVPNRCISLRPIDRRDVKNLE